MQADLPFYENAEQAITAAVQHLGGAKVVGAALWPDKSPDGARTRLLDCLNPSRAERLDLSESIFILRKARDKGYHAPFLWIAGELGYEARAVQRSEEIDRVAAVVEQASKQLATSLATLERLKGTA